MIGSSDLPLHNQRLHLGLPNEQDEDKESLYGVANIG